MPSHQVPANTKRDFLSLRDDTRRQAGKVAKVSRVEKGIRVVFGYQQAGDNVVSLRRPSGERADCLSFIYVNDV